MDQHLIGVIALLTGVMLFTYWINYVMGSPMARDVDNVDVGAILFFIPQWFAVERLARAMVLSELWERHTEELKLTDDPVRQREMETDFHRDLYEAGRKFFTWEKSILCPICLHWWLTVLVVGIALVFNWLQIRDYAGAAALTYLINHFFIRKIT